jgi:hypothetical protein
MDQLAPDVVQDKDKNFSWQKAKPAHQMRIKTNNVGSVDHGKIQSSGGTNQHPWKPADVMVAMMSMSITIGTFQYWYSGGISFLGIV